MFAPPTAKLPDASGASNLSARPDTSPPSPSRDSSNRRSIQFSADGADSPPPSRAASLKGLKWSPSRSRKREQQQHKVLPSSSRGASPPPPNAYERGVSFDTFDNRDAADFSLTLNYKHKGYQSTRRSRTFLCGTDQNDYSDFALEWLMDELVDDGDEIVCLRAVERDSRIASDSGVEGGKYRQEAEKLFEQAIQKNSQDEKAISLVVELAVGKVQDIIQRMIRIYEPAVLIVGTRGRSLNGMQSLLPGSVSKYCLQQSPIPVIVVRPSLKRQKKKKKRLADPSRRSYNHILEMSERRGSRIVDYSSSTDSSVSRLPDEEAAVADALGLPRSYVNSRSSLSVSDRGSVSHDEGDMLSPRSNSLDAVVMKSPVSGSVDTSDNESSRPCSADLSSLAGGGVVDDSNSSTPKAAARPTAGASSPQRSETRPEGESELTRRQFSIPVIVTEDISGDGAESS
ncbi:Universal stress protein family [Aspergillus sp. HF37]|nr:Universal stress protein family [Aspergillus sp. HF37]